MTDATQPATPRLGDLAVGDEVARGVVVVDRARLVRYANASGDQNPIHQDEAAAVAVGLPGVIAHGMWTMGAAVQVVVGWLGDPGAVLDYQTRFTRVVPVPAGAQVAVEVVATVGALDEAAGTARIDMAVSLEGNRVLTKAQAVVRLA
jgi:acyl dehydratase